jgi:short subunit fatty acids transporter
MKALNLTTLILLIVGGLNWGLARISHAIFAQLSRVARGVTSFFKGVLARVVRQTRAELGFFLSRGSGNAWSRWAVG